MIENPIIYDNSGFSAMIFIVVLFNISKMIFIIETNVINDIIASHHNYQNLTAPCFSHRVASTIRLLAALGTTSLLASCALPQLGDHRPYEVPEGAVVDTIYAANSAQNGKHSSAGNYVDERHVQGAGIDSHPRVEAARWFAESLRGEARALSAERYPRLNLQAASGYAYTSGRRNGSGGSGTGSSAGSGGSMGSGWRARHEARLVLSQRLFDGRRTKYIEDAGMSRAAAAELSANTLAQTIAIEYSTAHLDYLQARDVTSLARGLAVVHDKMLSVTSDKLSRGLQSQADVDLVRSRSQRSRTLLKSQELLMSDAAVRFRTISGKAPANAPAPPRASQSQLASLKMTNNWEIKAAEETLRSRQLENQAARRLSYPNVDLELGARAGDGFYGVASADEEVQALLVFNWDILDGGYRKAERYRTEAGIREAEELVKASQMDVRQLWELGRELRDKSHQRMIQLNSQISSLSQAIDALEADFASSKQPVLNVLDMQDELFEAKAEWVLEKYSKIRGEYAMLAASGELVDTLERSGIRNRSASRSSHLAAIASSSRSLASTTSRTPVIAATAAARTVDRPEPRQIHVPAVTANSRTTAPPPAAADPRPAARASRTLQPILGNSSAPVRRTSTYQRRNPYANPMGGFSGF
jgi:outer membrane protein TolC